MALSWGIYALGFFPKAQEKIRAEAALPWNERRYTEAFLKEVMRLYPPAALISRTTTKAENLNGLQVDDHEGILIPILAIQRHQDYWERPDEFWPERFLETEPAPMSYMPFGAGPRICIGQSFAMMEAAIIMPMIVEQYQITPSAHIPSPSLILTLRSSNGIKVNLTRRMQG